MASKQLSRRIVTGENEPGLAPYSTANAKPAVAHKKVSKTEKRRLAAFKSWEKRRLKQSIAASEDVAIVPPTNDTGLASSLQSVGDKSPPAISVCSITSAPDKSSKRRIAALKTWEKRRAKQGITPPVPATVVPPIYDDNDTSPAPEDSSLLSKTAVECIRSSSHAGVNKRSIAALKSWAKRRQQQCKAPSKSDAINPLNDPGSADAEEDASSTNGYVRQHKRGYTAELRSQAAKAAWERRKRLKTVNKSTAAADVTDTSEEDDATSKIADPKPKKAAKKKKRWHDPELKRVLPKRTSQEVEGIDDAIKDANQVITRLKHHRGWMEFHPSSRYGNGTADYAYIPGSLAQLIRNGAFSKPIVMEHGTLGVHFALDFEGYGGLRSMIETFGEDYCPCPSDAMIEASHELLEKKEQKVDQWDLGEDLPWKEVEKSEDERLDILIGEKRDQFQADSVELPNDIEEVSDILTSLFDANIDMEATNSSLVVSAIADVSTRPKVAKSLLETGSPAANCKIPSYSPALNALCGYKSESSDDDSDYASVASPAPCDEDLKRTSSNDADFNAKQVSSLGLSFTFNQDNFRESSEDIVMFGVPLYNPLQRSTPNSNLECTEDLSNGDNLGAPCVMNETSTQHPNFTDTESAEQGVHFFKDNRKVILLAPLEEEE